MPPEPKAGVCPLPILPALPAYGDQTFFTKADVPHGKIEQPTYKNFAGEDIYFRPRRSCSRIANAAADRLEEYRKRNSAEKRTAVQ
jgi:hypothetical protein